MAKLTPLRCVVLIIISAVVLLIIIFHTLKPMLVNTQHTFKQHKNFNQPPFPTDKMNHLEWFVQVSDIHVSIFEDKKRAPDLENFVNTHIKEVIKPEVVLVTGDLTDAKTSNRLGSTQFSEEWQAYYNVLVRTEIMQRTVWLDVRGNHDAFNVRALNDKQNMFRKYSSQGRHHARSYRYEHKGSDGGKISFIAMDACQDPGPKRPFNFFGVLRKNDITQLISLKEESAGSNMTFWFGHFPTSIIWSPDAGIRSVMSDSIYMSGHLHNMQGLAPSMYAFQSEGILEIELADWKHTRTYRVFAVDHDLFSFTDVKYNQWPVVLITNPKEAQFNLPALEPLGRMVHSTHIRMLVFSKFDISTLTVTIDGLKLGQGKHVEGPLYVCPWEADLFKHGVHEIEVYVQDTGGNKQTVSQLFSLDNSHLRQFKTFARFLLMVNHILVLKGLFWISMCYAVLPLLILRMFSIQVEVNINGRSLRGKLARYIQVWIRRICLIANSNKLFYWLFGFNLYIALGPWFIGELISGETGVAFVFGLYIKDTFIPGTLTYMYGFFQIISFNIPLMLYLGRIRDLMISEHKQKDEKVHHQVSVLQWTYNHGFFVGLLLYQLYMAVTGYYLAYGGVALLLCPVRTWSVPFAIWLRHIALSKSKDDKKKQDLDKNNHSIK